MACFQSPQEKNAPSGHLPSSLGGEQCRSPAWQRYSHHLATQGACCLPAPLHVAMKEELLQGAKGQASSELGMGMGLPGDRTSLRGIRARSTCALKTKVSLYEAPNSAEVHSHAEKAGPALGSGS